MRDQLVHRDHPPRTRRVRRIIHAQRFGRGVRTFRDGIALWRARGEIRGNVGHVSSSVGVPGGWPPCGGLVSAGSFPAVRPSRRERECPATGRPGRARCLPAAHQAGRMPGPPTPRPGRRITKDLCPPGSAARLRARPRGAGWPRRQGTPADTATGRDEAANGLPASPGHASTTSTLSVEGSIAAGAKTGSSTRARDRAASAPTEPTVAVAGNDASQPLPATSRHNP